MGMSSRSKVARRKPASRSGGRSAAGKRKPATAAVAIGTAEVDGLIPAGPYQLELRLGHKKVALTNLNKVFWPESGLTKGDLLRYYARMAPVLLPYLENRPMVMKRYPNGIAGKSFFMKRAPSPRPQWVRTCSIEHRSGNVIDFALVNDLADLLWLVNLGCIDLNPWYAKCDDVHRPDHLHFDLDPVPDADFADVCRAALLVHESLDELGAPNLAKTTGSRGIHVYVPIVRGPTQKEVWTVAKRLAHEWARRHRKIMTAEYRVARRPPGRVLVDYNQNAWGRTLASVYSVRPRAGAPVSTPVTWDEVSRGITIDEFRMDNVPERVARLGDLWRPVVERIARLGLEALA